MDKGTKVPEVSQVFRDAHAAGIFSRVFMICGFPTETIYDFAETIRFLEDHRDCIYAEHRGTFSLQREAPMFDMPEKFGITKVWLKKDDAFAGRWGYECPSGMSAEQAWQVFQNVLPFRRVFNPYAPKLANFRDRALLLYDRAPQNVGPELRPFPKVNCPERTAVMTEQFQ